MSKSKYQVEVHEVITKDDYILRLHRIIPQNRTKKFPVFMQHGIMATSGDFVITEEGSLGYLYTDNGYDVWIGNVRGNKFSSKHSKLAKQDPDFWDFSFHEMGIYDLPAMIDYTLKISGSSKLFLIAHSQGCTASLVMLSSRPEYNDVILQAHLIAPASFMDHMPNSYLRSFTPTLLEGFKQFPNFDLLINNPVAKESVETAIRTVASCTDNSLTMETCRTFYRLFCGTNKERVETDLKLTKKHWKFLSTTLSMKQIIHFGQLLQSGKFRRFDYDDKNMPVYGSLRPPDYKLKNVKASVFMYAGGCDAVVAMSDIEHLKSSLPNVKLFKKLKNYNHVDLIYGKYAKEDIYNDMIIATDKETATNM